MILTLLSNKARVEQATATATAERHRLWDDWNRRREEAAAKGLSFDEPPPEAPAGFYRNGQ